MNVKAISLNVGKALLVSALFMFLSIVVSLIDGMDSAFTPLLISFIITLIVGSFPFIFVRSAQAMSLNDGFLTIVLSWLQTTPENCSQGTPVPESLHPSMGGGIDPIIP